MRIAAFALSAALSPGGAQAQIINDRQSVSSLREQALADKTAWTLVLATAADADIDFRHPDAPKGLGK